MSRNSRARTADADAQLRLSFTLREKLKAVVFDANAYGNARPDFDHLGRLAERLAGISVETWVPEPVAWEWAEHLASDWQVMKNAASSERKRLLDAGLDVPAPSVYSARGNVVTAVLATLEKIPHVRIIELTGPSAIEGLRDQVLLRAPAKRKNGKTPDDGVKTGASDSAWIRDVLTLANPDEILIVSKDRDVRAAFEAWDKPLPVLRPLAEVRPTLFDFTVDDGHARAAIVRYLRERLPSGRLDEGTLDVGRIVGLESAWAQLDDGGLGSSAASVTELVALAGIGVVRVEANESSAPGSADRRRDPADPGAATLETADATVFLLATGEATVPTSLYAGDPEVSSVIPISNVLVRARLTFQFADGVITSMAADTDASAEIIQDAFDDSESLEAELIEALNIVPGIVLDEHPLQDQDISIPGTNAHVELNTDRFGDRWESEVRLWFGNDEEQELSETTGVECEYDPSSWWGGSRDGFQGPSAYPVSLYGEAPHRTHGVWGVPAWLISRINWPQFPAPVSESAAEPASEESAVG
ncbi:hypothetical protein [Streptomyces sp. NBU3104]|uniref:hypothetical protein n=1 Tax=Streptomyces sp. NBU3104 TaxID=2911367 RepID=UPI001EDC69C0|nr:hypothetical protein [Streptomyces sp. NBU3104]UKL04204.1 hypothetical protein L2I08_15415 [Streptomyces sp. NBU3104]